MLRFLSIRNLAVIDRLEVEFDPGFNVLTGETGAGKSILVGAVGLLAGGRASADLVRTGEEVAAVEAIFEEAGEDGATRELIVRREISSQSGRSRAFLNGALASNAALREAASRLVDLHGQHDHQQLLDPSTHLDMLDTFAGLDEPRGQVSRAFERWSAVREEQRLLAAGEREAHRRAEFLEFQLDEIRRVAPRAGEDDELAAARRVLANADRLQRLSADAYSALYDGESAALTSLAAVWRKVADLAAIDPQFAPYLAGRDAVKSQLEDLAFFLRSYAADIDASPGRLQDVEDRLAVLERLKKKHGATLDEVLAAASALQQELDTLRTASARAATLDAELAAASAAYREAADALSARRRAAAIEFARRLERSLADLAMARTRCQVVFEADTGESSWTARGRDVAEFHISPNPGEELRPLARIVSGGELSRVMLALKTLASTDAPGKTLIFDEVDAGIGGAVADVVGAHLRELAGKCQVLCITHLPQIAAYGTSHYRITKSAKGTRTATEIGRLQVRQREEELARMIAGSDVSPSIRASAREMLEKKR